jgi:uncharacterized protein involved in exopolysaccharide biosynthesis
VLPFLSRIVATNLKLLIAGALLAGIAGYVVASSKTKYYTSSAYLRMDENGARSANAIMSSPVTLDKVLAKIKVPGDTIEARRRFIDGNRRMVVAPGEIPRTSKFFRHDFTSSDPRVAQQVNSLILESWIEATKPPPYRTSSLQSDIERIESQTKTMSDLIDRLSKETPTLLAENSMQGELASPIAALIIKRDQNRASIMGLKEQLLGVTEDVILSPPDLPEEPVSTRRSVIAVLWAIGGGLLMFAFVGLRAVWWRRAA